MKPSARACTLAACALAGALAAASGTASGDSFTPIKMQVSIPAVGRLHGPLPVTVAVTADAGALDTRTSPLRVRVKLAAECAGEFDHTAGIVLLDSRLKPQPDPSEPYQGSTSGSGKPKVYGSQTVCVFLEDEDKLQFATDTSAKVNITQQCTVAAAHYDTAAAALARARTALRHAHGTSERRRLQKLVGKRRAAADSARRVGTSACGSGLPL